MGSETVILRAPVRQIDASRVMKSLESVLCRCVCGDGTVILDRDGVPFGIVSILVVAQPVCCETRPVFPLLVKPNFPP